MNILHIDIETSPNLAHVWSLWNQNVSLAQLQESTEMLCFAAKWHGRKNAIYSSVHGDGKEKMVKYAWDFLDAADVVVHYNGRRFDVPHLNREFVEAKLPPPSPFKQVDILDTVKKRFRFPSNKLQYVSKALGLAGKVQHSGHTLWVQCMAGDPKAWKLMEKYNKQDVVLLEDLYTELLPWISSHPSVPLLTGDHGEDRCNRCGSSELEKRGYAYTTTARFQQYRCKECGGWLRSGKAVARVDLREVAS